MIKGGKGEGRIKKRKKKEKKEKPKQNGNGQNFHQKALAAVRGWASTGWTSSFSFSFFEFSRLFGPAPMLLDHALYPDHFIEQIVSYQDALWLIESNLMINLYTGKGPNW